MMVIKMVVVLFDIVQLFAILPPSKTTSDNVVHRDPVPPDTLAP
jgi:hypothetical protein